MNTNYTVNSKNREEIVNWLQKNLTEERFEHTLGVEETAIFLAEKFGLNKEKAALAGLLHDCAKCLCKEELRRIIDEKIKDIDENELMNYKTYHAPVGEIFAKEIFGIEDPEILSAIRVHTLGKVNMTNFEKIIFLADKIEGRTREKDYREMILKILEEKEGLNKALFICFRETVKSLAVRELAICPVTIDVYNWLLQETKMP